MTGIELALAILPLMIAAADYQKHIIEGTKIMSSNKTRDERQLDFYYELFDELSLLASTLEGLFAGSTSRRTEGAAALSDEERKALDELLGSRAVSFQSILDRLLKSLEDIISEKSIDISKSDVSILSPMVFFVKLERFKSLVEKRGTTSTLVQRFRFTRNEKSRQCAMKKIKENNEKLERLLRGSDINYCAHRTTKRKPRSTRLRRLSEPLFTKIATKWSGACDCQGHHEARLCLWNCCSQQKIDRSMDSIDMMVSVSDIGEDGTPWQESLILIPSEPSMKQPESGVRFAGVSEAPPSTIPRREVDAESFCSLIRSAYGQQAPLHLVFEGGKFWQTRARRRSLAIDKQRDVTLSQLLANSTHKFSLKEQRVLAVVLAHAALHCSTGPWLSEKWSKEHISFFRHDSATHLDVRHPFLRLRFDEEVVESAEDLFCIHPNPRLLSLGILLLELYLEATIESQWSDTDLSNGQANGNTNLTAALRLLEDSEDKVYEGYRAAIRACLEFDVATPDTEDLRQKIYEDIVLPLELELEHGFHITPEDLQLVS